jgi:hypothetical protein
MSESIVRKRKWFWSWQDERQEAWLAMMVVGLAMFKRFPGRHPSWVVALFMVVFTVAILFAALNAVMIQSRIKELKQGQPL